MTFDKYLLDSNIVSKLCHPKNSANTDIVFWFINFLNKDGKEIYLPEIVAYEVRRGLRHKQLQDPNSKNFERFEAFSKHLTYQPINTKVFQIAEKLWVEARMNGYSTASNDSLDGDVLLAAQALEIGASVITENVKHLKNYVKTYHWKDLQS